MDQVDTMPGTATDVSTEEVSVNEVSDQGNAQQDEQETQEKYTPFANGKEKFLVNGKEEEWDWETAKKYAQIGKAGYSNLELAAQMRKEAERVQSSAKETYAKLIEYARRDPEGLIRVLNPQYQATRQSMAEMSQDTDWSDSSENKYDPRDLKIAQLEERLQKWEADREAELDRKEYEAYQSELKSAQERFPRFKHPASLAYLKDQYKKALNQKLSLSVEDVAQLVDEHLTRLDTQTTQTKAQRYEENRRKSPVSSSPAGLGNKKEMSLDDVKKLAGRI